MRSTKIDFTKNKTPGFFLHLAKFSIEMCVFSAPSPTMHAVVFPFAHIPWWKAPVLLLVNIQVTSR